jgi:hypothetical protein
MGRDRAVLAMRRAVTAVVPPQLWRTAGRAGRRCAPPPWGVATRWASTEATDEPLSFFRRRCRFIFVMNFFITISLHLIQIADCSSHFLLVHMGQHDTVCLPCHRASTTRAWVEELARRAGTTRHDSPLVPSRVVPNRVVFSRVCVVPCGPFEHIYMALARTYKRRVAATLSAPPFRAPRQQACPLPLPASPSSMPSATTAPLVATSSVPPHPFRRLSPAEMTVHRRLSLCYNCDEQYVRGHKCPCLFYLEVADPEDELPNLMDKPLLAAREDEPLITLNAITGIRGDGTMEVCVTVGTREFNALLDSGSTTNFISSVVGRTARLQFHSGNGPTFVWQTTTRWIVVAWPVTSLSVLARRNSWSTTSRSLRLLRHGARRDDPTHARANPLGLR